MNIHRRLFLLSLIFFQFITAQNISSVESRISDLYIKSLTKGMSYSWLEHLSKNIGGRLSGSLNTERAIDWVRNELINIGLDSVWLQPVMVSKWVRGSFEYANIESSPGNIINVNICSLGGSIATPKGGIKAKVVEVKNLEELKSIGRKNINGKIVFFNRPMEPGFIDTFKAYEGALDQRYSGAAEAAKYGAVAVIVRSMNLRLDDYPHTGEMSYGSLPISKRIPAAAISTNDAELLSSMISLNPNLNFFLRQDCKNYPDVKSYNVIGQIKGTDFPEKIILVGAHIDSWDLGDGAHDDGAGVVQCMEVLRLLKIINYKPKNTIRLVLFVNEENGGSGAKAYSEIISKKREKHILALESDSGAFAPKGFVFDTGEAYFERILKWKPYFQPYNINLFKIDYIGTDFRLLNNDALVLSGLKTDSQRYFIYHHSEIDTFETINKRELEIGSATMAALIFLTDYIGLE